MSKAYMNEGQTQQTAPLAKPLPGLGAPMHPGVAALQEGARPAPAEMLVDDAGELILFEDSDIRQALAIYDASRRTDRLAAMREAIMFAIKVAAINTGAA